MKRNLLLLAVMTLVMFGFSSFALADVDPNDNGIPDTLYMECWPGDEGLLPGGSPWDVDYPIYVTHDIEFPLIDSVAGIVVPLQYTFTNASANVTIDPAKNKCGDSDLNRTLHNLLYDLNLSVFRDLPTMESPTELNWMMDLATAGGGLEWDTRILNLETGRLMLTLIATGGADLRLGPCSRLLIASIRFTLEDSTNICIDSTFFTPSNRVTFARADAQTYIPQIWDDYDGPEVCVEHYIIPNIPPYFTDGVDDQTHSVNGPVVTDNFTVQDDDGTISSVTASAAPAGIANVVVVLAKDSRTGHVTYDVIDHCAAGGSITLTVTDDAAGTGTDDFNITLTNAAPVVTCPGDASITYCEDFAGVATFTDANGDAVTFSGSGNPAFVTVNADGSIDADPDCDDVGVHTITVVATETSGSCALTGQCTFQLTVTNDLPTITCPANLTVTAGELVDEAFSFTDDCNNVTIAGVVVPTATNLVNIVGTQVQWQTSALDPEGDYVITLTITDICGGLTADCDFTVKLLKNPAVVIGPIEDDCVDPGEMVEVPISIEKPFPTKIGGFELQIEFDYTSMTFVKAERGDLIPAPEAEEPGWEKFSYRLLPCPSCGCCKYKILLFGMYDLPNPYPGVYIPAGVTGDLVILTFVVNNDQNLRCMGIPICFEFEPCIECGANTFSDVSGDTLYVSYLSDLNPLFPDEVEDCHFQAECCDDPGYGTIVPSVFFQPDIDNQVQCYACYMLPICCDGPEECKRGDVNYNHMAYEVADAVMFASYFVNGPSVFLHDEAYQICATDVNADGRPLTLSDLVYLIRVILHDAAEMHKLGPSSEVANVIVYNGTITTDCAASIGAILFEFDSAVEPTLLANMEMVHNGNKVLVWSSTGNSFSTAQVISLAGEAELVSVSAVDRDSRELSTTITTKVAPTSFALHAAYPNPFNPFTNLSFSMPEATAYSLKIYNVAGQLVRSYEGMGSVGLNVVTWDGKDNAGSEVSSGVYFYKLIAKGFSATQKMVMMK